MTSAADRIAAIQERLDRIAMFGFTLGIVKQTEGDVDYDNVRWLLRRYEDARERLERIGSPLNLATDGACPYCVILVKRKGHEGDCPWRIAREHLEAE